MCYASLQKIKGIYMPEPKTNFARVLTLLGARPRDLVVALSADKSVVSRWYNGKQKLMPGHSWVERVADFLIEKDSRLKMPVLPEILRAYYPAENMDTANVRRELLMRWLHEFGWRPAQLQKGHTGLAGMLQQQIDMLSVPPAVQELAPAPPQQNSIVVYGIEGVQGSVLQFLELVTQRSEPCEVLFACPEGLEMLTRDKRFLPGFIGALMKMFAMGHSMSVVIRTDYRVSDIAEFSGPWLVAHLLGYIHSYYYDDFVGSAKDKMLAVVPGIIAGRVNETDTGELFTAIHFDKRTIESIHGKIKRYQEKGKQRFHYSLFEQPDEFLRGTVVHTDKPHYLFARLPHFCTVQEEGFQESFSLTENEMVILRSDFCPILTHPGFFDRGTSLRHIFCENDIEDVLLKSRHVSVELSAILGRRVVMTTQTLVDRLALLKKLLAEYKNYEICFLREEHFIKIQMQIAAFGDSAAIGWIAGGKSTACRDYTNVNALTGFCETVWNKMPGPMKLRRVATGKISTWLKMAEKYGYIVK